MYLANDVIQNSKKKGPEYGQEFGEVLIGAFEHMSDTGINEKTKHSLNRILKIWEDRGVYDSEKVKKYKIASKIFYYFYMVSIWKSKLTIVPMTNGTSLL